MTAVPTGATTMRTLVPIRGADVREQAFSDHAVPW